jgi:predicted dehydrogenase
MRFSQMHVVQAIEALEAGKHVFVEKPLALTLRGAEIVESARQKAGKVVFVGTMRRYATAFERVKARVKEVGNEGIAYGG